MGNSGSEDGGHDEADDFRPSTSAVIKDAIDNYNYCVNGESSDDGLVGVFSIPREAEEYENQGYSHERAWIEAEHNHGWISECAYEYGCQKNPK